MTTATGFKTDKEAPPPDAIPLYLNPSCQLTLPLATKKLSISCRTLGKKTSARTTKPLKTTANNAQ